MAGLHFELVSPAKLLFSGNVAAVTLPGTEGEMTIMPMHAPVLVTLRPGIITVAKDGGATDKMFVRGGFAEVNAKGLTVLAETAIAMADFNANALAAQISSAENEVTAALEGEAKRKAMENLDHLRGLQGAV